MRAFFPETENDENSGRKLIGRMFLTRFFLISIDLILRMCVEQIRQKNCST